MEGEEKSQFDILLGGTEELPSELPLMKFASARVQEIVALTEAIEDPQKTALVFQRLPKLMRRRVMSHNAKRMPRRLREAHTRQLEKSGLPPKSKRPSRKYRRRPQNLLLEYTRRQKRFVWLETHIWHAKRFHMIEKWGYKLANFPNDKSFRACYRASANHCLLQDISYYCCIELAGPLDKLLNGLNLHTNAECGLTFAAKAFLTGNREGKVTVFHKGTFPFGALGSVNFLWKPEEKGQGPHAEKRTLWIWVHPSVYSDILHEIINTFGFSLLENKPSGIAKEIHEQCDVINIDSSKESNIPLSGNNLNSPIRKKARFERKNKTIEETKVATESVFVQTPEYRDSSEEVHMILLKDTLNRFRLTGPLSQAILLDTLNVFDVTQTQPSLGEDKSKESCDDIEEIFCSLGVDSVTPAIQLSDSPSSSKADSKAADCEVITLKSSSDDDMEVTVLDSASTASKPAECLWWVKFYGADEGNRRAWQVQRTLWAGLKSAVSPAQLPPHQVLALTVTDPRYQMPAKRKKVVPDPNDFSGEWSAELFSRWAPQASSSAIWSCEVRLEATSGKLSTAQLAQERAKNLVPGFMEEELSSSTTVALRPALVPVLLLQRPGSQDAMLKRLGFDSGWDVVLPAGWAMPLWLALVFRGARVGGLREAESLAFEAGSGPWSETFAPDTATGRKEADTRKQLLTDKHFRLPPDKRPNYIKLGVVSPFGCCWDVLIRDWCKDLVHHSDSSSENPFYVLRERKKLAALKLALDSCQTMKKVNKKKHNFHRCQSSNTSSLSVEFANIDQKCLVPVMVVLSKKGSPSDNAMICIPTAQDLENLCSNPQFEGPMEPAHEDRNHEQRKDLRSKHQKLLRRLRKQRIRMKRKREEKESDAENSGKDAPVSTSKKRKAVPPTKDLVDVHAEEMRSLWLPEFSVVKNSSSRTVLGFVCKGDFSFTEACGVGLGYVVLPALLQLVSSRTRQPLVLVRNPSSLQYRFAALHVC